MSFLAGATIEASVNATYILASSNIILTCDVTVSVITPTFKWKFNDTYMNSEINSTFTLLDAQPSDTGSYLCEVSWPDVGTLPTAEYVLNVREIVVPTTSFFLGSDTTMVTLSCMAYGDAVSEVVWSSQYGTDVSGMNATLVQGTNSYEGLLEYEYSISLDNVTCSFTYTSDGVSIGGDTVTLQYIEGNLNKRRSLLDKI